MRLTLLLSLFGALAMAQGPVPDFRPDTTFSGSVLTGWKPLGEAKWVAREGEITGTGTGWLVSEKSWQDVGFFARFRCTGECKTGVLLRVQKTATGMKGIYLSLAAGDEASYAVTLDPAGKELSRTKLAGVGPFIRVAPAPNAAPSGAGAGGPGRAGAGGRGPGRGGAGKGGKGMTLPVPLAPLAPPPPGFRAEGWNEIELMLNANILRPVLNTGVDYDPVSTEDSSGYGPVALFVGGGEVRFKDVSFQDLHSQKMPAEQTSSRFRVQKLDDLYYAWGTAIADFNHDGVKDVVAGPYVYLGPKFTERQEIYIGVSYAPGTQFTQNMVTYAHDFTGDGWPDVLASESRPMVLYVNPRGENRRWHRFPVLAGVTTEITLLKDLDGDGRPEVIFGTANGYSYAKYDPAKPTEPWAQHRVSDASVVYAHGLGVGDINGDGRPDILNAAGWWEQPPTGAGDGLWKYHPVAFGRWGRSEGAGGAEMAVFDVNGDGLNDVVCGVNAHGFGLAWFEQKRSGGEISFERHMVMDDFSTKNAGGVTISEMHAALAGDVDGDGIPDFITGKRHFSHLESDTDADPWGAPVLYWFRTVRNKKAPGGAEFVPELIHNRSGVGSQFSAEDLNGDGALDIVTTTNRGTFVFWGTGSGTKGKKSKK